DRSVEPGVRGGELLRPVDEGGSGEPARTGSAVPAPGGRTRRRTVERRILREDRPLEVLQGATGLDAEIGEHRAPRGPIRVERLRLPAGAIEGDHQLPAQSLPQRMSRHERLQLGGEIVVSAERQVGLESILRRGDVQLLEPRDLLVRKSLVREVRERRPTPEAERPSKEVCRLRMLFRREGGTTLGDEPLEAVSLELAGPERPAVGAADRPQGVRAGGLLLAEGGNAVLQALCRRV